MSHTESVIFDRLLLILIAVSLICSCGHDEKNSKAESSDEIVEAVNNDDLKEDLKKHLERTVDCSMSVFLGVEYSYDDEFLYLPIDVKQNPLDDSQLFILDKGNNALFVFSKQQKLIKKIGRAGQGPGDLLRPSSFQFDEYGDVYIFDGGNKRISKFSNAGDFILSFRTPVSTSPVFSVISPDSILCNNYESGYYLSILDSKGNVIKEIGETDSYGSFIETASYATAFPFFDREKRLFYAFQKYAPNVLIFSEDGEFLEKRSLKDEVFFHNAFVSSSRYSDPEKNGNSQRFTVVTWHVSYQYGDYYIITLGTAGKPDIYSNGVYRLDNSLSLKRYYNLYATDSRKDPMRAKLYDGCSVSHDLRSRMFYYTTGKAGEVIQFKYQ